MNAVAPPPKRPYGRGTVAQYSGQAWWFIRTPGAKKERGGFRTRADAEAALDRWLDTGVAPPMRCKSTQGLRNAIARARTCAAELGMTLEAAMLSIR